MQVMEAGFRRDLRDRVSIRGVHLRHTRDRHLQRSADRDLWIERLKVYSEIGRYPPKTDLLSNK